MEAGGGRWHRPRTRDRSAPRSGTTEGRGRLCPVSTWASLCLPSRGAAPATIGGGEHGSHRGTRRRARRAPGLGGGLCHSRRGGAPTDQGGAQLRHHAPGPRGPARLAARERGHARRDGGDRRLPAARPRRPGGRLHPDRRQRPPHQGGAGPQDRREGRRVDRRAGPARAGARQLRAPAGGPGAARAGAPPQGAATARRWSAPWRRSATARSSCWRAPASSSRA